jgi:hypothetical protein
MADQDNSAPGPGHNQEPEDKEVVWDFWQKKRTFVRALEGTYGEVYKSLYAQPRIFPTTQVPWHGGPQFWAKPSNAISTCWHPMPSAKSTAI